MKPFNGIERIKTVSTLLALISSCFLLVTPINTEDIKRRYLREGMLTLYDVLKYELHITEVREEIKRLDNIGKEKQFLKAT